MGLEPADPPDQLTPPFVGLFANIHIILLLVDWVLHFPRPFFSTCPTSCLAAKHLALSSPCHVFLFIFSHFFLLFILPFWFFLCPSGHCCPWSCPNFLLICHLQTLQCSSHSNLFFTTNCIFTLSFFLCYQKTKLPSSSSNFTCSFVRGFLSDKAPLLSLNCSHVKNLYGMGYFVFWQCEYHVTIRKWF